jgi:hypothetical protein
LDNKICYAAGIYRSEEGRPVTDTCIREAVTCTTTTAAGSDFVYIEIFINTGNPLKYTDPDGNTPKYATLINAANFDFGRDYMGLGEANFKEGEYGWAALMFLDAFCEAGYDFLAIVGGASLVSNITRAGITISTIGAPTAVTGTGVVLGTQVGKLGTFVNNPSINVNWAKATPHGLERLVERGVSKEMIEGWVSAGKVLQQTSDKFIFITKRGAAVVTKAGELVTAYTNTDFDQSMQAIVKQLFE